MGGLVLPPTALPLHARKKKNKTKSKQFFKMPPKRFQKAYQDSAKKRSKIERPPFVPMKKPAFGARDPGFVDVAQTTRVMDTTGSISLVATIAQGTTVNTRIGKKAQYKSIHVRGLVVSGTSTTNAQGAWILVYDRRPTGALPAITDILDTASEDSFPNDTNSGRFHTIRRMDYNCIGSQTNDTAANCCRLHNIDTFVKFKKPITFKALGTGAINDIEMGAIYLVTVGNQVAGATAATSSIGTRTRFVDI